MEKQNKDNFFFLYFFRKERKPNKKKKKKKNLHQRKVVKVSLLKATHLQDFELVLATHRLN